MQGCQLRSTPPSMNGLQLLLQATVLVLCFAQPLAASNIAGSPHVQVQGLSAKEMQVLFYTLQVTSPNIKSLVLSKLTRTLRKIWFSPPIFHRAPLPSLQRQRRCLRFWSTPSWQQPRCPAEQSKPTRRLRRCSALR